MSVRWGIQAAVLFVVISMTGARLIHERPWVLWDLAVPAVLSVTASVLFWRRIASRFPSLESPRGLVRASATVGAIGMSFSAAYILIRSGAFWADPGEQGGAVLIIFMVASFFICLVATPVAFLLPRLLDPALRPGAFSTDSSRNPRGVG